MTDLEGIFGKSAGETPAIIPESEYKKVLELIKISGEIGHEELLRLIEEDKIRREKPDRLALSIIMRSQSFIIGDEYEWGCIQQLKFVDSVLENGKIIRVYSDSHRDVHTFLLVDEKKDNKPKWKYIRYLNSNLNPDYMTN